MKFIPYQQLGQFIFSESFDKIKKLANAYNKIELSDKIELEKKYPSIYIYDINTLIVFNLDGKSVRYIETTQEIILEGCNLKKTSLSKIKAYFSKLDDSTQIDEEGTIESKKYGFNQQERMDKKGNSVLLFTKSYLEEEMTPEDIIKYYLGKNSEF